MNALWRIVALAPPSRWRLALSACVGAAAVVFGIGLMTTAGYLIARAAEHPEILSLTTVIVAVRFFGLARPVARYLERLSSHDLAFRVLARLRARFYRRIEPLAPAALEQYRRGDLVSRMVGDVDALQGLYLRGVGPPLVALLAGAVAVGAGAAMLPAAALVLAVGYMGFWKSSLMSITDVFRVIDMDFPVFQKTLVWYLFAGFTVVSTVLWGRFYCGRVCAFGALTQLIDAVFPARWRIEVPKAIEARAAWIKVMRVVGKAARRG